MNDLIAKQIFDNLNLKVGQIIAVSKNGQLLNYIFGTNYKEWMKARWFFKDGLIVWMGYIDGKIRNGWKNYEIDNTIIEENVYKRTEYDNHGIKALLHAEPYRIVFQKSFSNGKNCFIVKGVYKTDIEKSDAQTLHFYNKI